MRVREGPDEQQQEVFIKCLNHYYHSTQTSERRQVWIKAVGVWRRMQRGQCSRTGARAAGGSQHTLRQHTLRCELPCARAPRDNSGYSPWLQKQHITVKDRLLLTQCDDNNALIMSFCSSLKCVSERFLQRQLKAHPVCFFYIAKAQAFLFSLWV